MDEENRDEADQTQSFNPGSAINPGEFVLALLFAISADIIGLIPFIGALIAAGMGGAIWFWLFLKGQNFRKKYSPHLAMGGSTLLKFVPFIGPVLGLYTVVVARAYFRSKRA